MKTFSIITITKDNLPGLQQTYQSLQEQTCRDFEWIVQDGHSRDGTVFYLQETDADWHSAPDKGIYDAMNRATARAAGQYVLYLNAGDRFADFDVLEDVKAYIEKAASPPDLIYGDSLEEWGLQKKRRAKPAKSAASIWRGLFTHHQAILYKRGTLRDKPYDDSYRIAGDYDLTLRLLQSGASAGYLNRPICLFSRGGLSQQNPRLGREEQKQSRAHNKTCPALINSAIASYQAFKQSLRARLEYF